MSTDAQYHAFIAFELREPVLSPFRPGNHIVVVDAGVRGTADMVQLFADLSAAPVPTGMELVPDPDVPPQPGVVALKVASGVTAHLRAFDALRDKWSCSGPGVAWTPSIPVTQSNANVVKDADRFIVKRMSLFYTVPHGVTMQVASTPQAQAG